LNKPNQVADNFKEKIGKIVKNMYQESMMHYRKDNQYTGLKKSAGYTKLIKEQNIFVANRSTKLIRYFQEGQNSQIKANTYFWI
jgi:hypothetical protein